MSRDAARRMGLWASLLAESGAQATILDGGDSVRLIDFPSGVGPHTALTGFTVRNGRAGEGGGIRVQGASPLISHCIVSDCIGTEDGGGLFVSGGAPRIVNCTFSGNQADDDGGGIRCTNASPWFVACVISSNTAHDHGGGFYGNDSGALFDGCLISGNTAVDGGGVGCNGSTIEMNRCALLDNWAHTDGGGLRAKDSQPRVRNSLFARNRAFGDGGGVHLKGPTAVLALENCTVMDNRARLAGSGMAAGDNATASATNSIFWGNVPDQLDGISGLAYSCVEGGAAGTGILTNHPALTVVYYRLLPESPCIDAGTNAAWMVETTDFHGQARIDDDTVDIGADEWHGSGAGGDVPGVGTPGGIWSLPPAPDPDRLRLVFRVGDPSNSGSEKYRIVFSNEVETVVFDNTAFGVVHAYTNDFLKGTTYTLRVEHLETDGTSQCGSSPDYDYQAEIESIPNSWNGSHPAWIYGPGFAVHDPDRILGTHWTDNCTGTFAASNKTATLYILKVDILDPAEDDVHLKGEEVKFDGDVEPTGLSGLTYAWSVLEGTCDPATATTEDFQTTLKSEGTIKVKLAVTISGTTCEKIRTIKAMLPEVTKLRWNDDHDMTKWGGGAISDPVWVKTLGGGVTKNEPGTYTKDAEAKAELAIEAADPLTHSTSVQVKGVGNKENFYAGGATFHNWTWGSEELVLDSSTLYSSVNFYDTLDVTWYYCVQKLAGGWGDWVEMNQSSHILYTVNADPNADPLYDRGVDKGCRYANGAADFADAINSGFAAEIYYDPREETYHDLRIFNVGYGQCCCHAYVFSLLLSHVTDATPAPTYCWGGCSGSTICFFKLYGTGPGWWWGPSFQCQRPATDYPAANPHFTFHVEVPFNGTVYDPAYGLTGWAPLLETALAVTNTHPTAASFQSGSSLPSTEHKVDWICGPH